MDAIESVRAHRNVRGFVFEPLNGTELLAQSNVHVVITEPGAVRGNHRHARGTEVLTVIGPTLVRTRVDGVLRDTHVAADEVVRFTLLPGVAHAIQNTGDRRQVLVSFNTVAHDPADPDVIHDMLIPAT
jgi:dTDP-4-dehydrorhamnose 3,5-epimerase-like enzyme